ncbi:MAG: hypothetical protein AAF928_19005 [Myxococcota bacterium]
MGWYLPPAPPGPAGCRLRDVTLWSLDEDKRDYLDACPLSSPVKLVNP